MPDAHFLCSGHRPDDLYGYFMTEEEGKAIKVFPIQEKLRYLVPFHQVSETIDYLRDLANDFHTYYNAHQFLVGDEKVEPRFMFHRP